VTRTFTREEFMNQASITKKAAVRACLAVIAADAQKRAYRGLLPGASPSYRLGRSLTAPAQTAAALPVRVRAIPGQVAGAAGAVNDAGRGARKIESIMARVPYDLLRPAAREIAERGGPAAAAYVRLNYDRWKAEARGEMLARREQALAEEAKARAPRILPKGSGKPGPGATHTPPKPKPGASKPQPVAPKPVKAPLKPAPVDLGPARETAGRPLTKPASIVDVARRAAGRAVPVAVYTPGVPEAVGAASGAALAGAIGYLLSDKRTRLRNALIGALTGGAVGGGAGYGARHLLVNPIDGGQRMSAGDKITAAASALQLMQRLPEEVKKEIGERVVAPAIEEAQLGEKVKEVNRIANNPLGALIGLGAREINRK
jgi:hypothetical protein